MKITPQDMNAIRDLFTESDFVAPLSSDARDMALAHQLIEIYDRGYEEGWRDAEVREGPS